MKRILLFAVLGIFSGCANMPVSNSTASTTTDGSAVATNAPILPTGTVAHAVCAGLTKLDATAADYNGWDGTCPGCDVDAKAMYARCIGAGVQATLLLNEQATKAGFESAILAAAADLKRGDLLIVTLSGHGGQVKDINGDEADGLDETICLYDGQMVDDHVLEIILKLPPGLRVLMITDTCHSEGNFRAFVRYATKVVTLGKYGKKPTTRPLIRKAARGWDGELIQFAGCREDSYSYGTSAGGAWTTALDGQYPQAATLRAWFDLAIKTMAPDQQPQWVEFGNVTDAFRFSVPLH